MAFNNTDPQLTSMKDFDLNRIVFSDAISGSIPDSKPAITFKRINFNYRYPNGEVGPLLIPTASTVFSFGLSENVSQETGKVSGHVFPLALYNKDSPTEDEKNWVTVYNSIVEHAKEHLVSVRQTLGRTYKDIEIRDLKKLNNLYWKLDKETDEIVPGTGPTLYTKVLSSKKQDKIISLFYMKAPEPENEDDEREEDERVDPLSLLGKFCHAEAVIKFDSIFIGGKISLQVKLYEATVKLVQSGMKRLLARPSASSQVRVELPQSLSRGQGKLPMEDKVVDADDAGSLVGSDDEKEDKEDKEDKPKPKVPAKRVVKKVVRKPTA